MKTLTFIMNSGNEYARTLDITSVNDFVKSLQTTEFLVFDDLVLKAELIESIHFKEPSDLNT